MHAGRTTHALLTLALMIVALPAAAQRQAEAPYKPTAVKFDPAGLTLLDAVRLTLEHDPNIKLSDTDTAYRAGALRQQSGRFDTVLTGTFQFRHAQDELRDSAKQSEQKRRSDLDAAIPKVEALAGSLNRAVTNLNTASLVNNPGTADLAQGVTDTNTKSELGIIQSQLKLLDDLIAANPSLRTSLTTLRQKTVSDSINRFTQEYNAVKDEPGRLRKLREDMGDAPEEQFQRRGEVRLDLSKPLRSGILFAPYADLTFTQANYVGKSSWDPNFGGLGVRDMYKGEVGFELLLPLRRGLGSDSVAAGEKAAKQDLEASRLSMLHQKTYSVLSTVLAYWEARAAAEQIDVLKRSVTLQTDLTKMIQELIKRGERARADESRVLASLADSQARLDAAERRSHEARVNLARVIGVALADVASVPLASDPFPTPPESVSAAEAALANFAAQAAGQRYDRQAAIYTQESERILEKGARLDTRSQINLDTFFFGSSVGEQNPKFGSWVFQSYSAALDFEKPLGNNERLGVADQRTASLRRATIESADLERTIALNVVRLSRALAAAAVRLRHAEEAVRNYDQTIKDEQAKLRLGDSTLVDTILTEQQTTSARLALVAAQQDYASQLARLRYESGLLVRDERGGSSVSPETLLTVPAALVETGARR